MKRIFIVGINNKPGKLPLDESTLSGQRIAEAINAINRYYGPQETIRTNLFDADEAPPLAKGACVENVRQWAERVKYNPETDFIISLGSHVAFNFIGAKVGGVWIWFANHPADRRFNQLRYNHEIIEGLKRGNFLTA